jgi:hypothetical protein
VPSTISSTSHDIAPTKQLQPPSHDITPTKNPWPPSNETTPQTTPVYIETLACKQPSNSISSHSHWARSQCWYYLLFFSIKIVRSIGKMPIAFHLDSDGVLLKEIKLPKGNKFYANLYEKSYRFFSPTIRTCCGSCYPLRLGVTRGDHISWPAMETLILNMSMIIMSTYNNPTTHLIFPLYFR